MFFNGRVISRFPYRICRDGTLVTRSVPRFTDIDKIVTIATVPDAMAIDPAGLARGGELKAWSIRFNREWTNYEVRFGGESMLGWIHTD